ncbi:hypothetical protein B0H19DRAFT_1150185 [Mycena capillaripes]|nr:hypothetical protein B0H19DRAFT_1150185 [Mycena capillaripes]
MLWTAVNPLRTAPGIQREWLLDIWWNRKHGLEELTLHILSEDRQSRWETHLERLIRECVERRADEHGPLRRRGCISTGQDKAGLTPTLRTTGCGYEWERMTSSVRYCSRRS